MFSPAPLTNPLKRKLLEGGTVLGAVLSTNSPEVAAHVARLGFDFLWVEMEHFPITLDGLRNIILATRGLPAIPIARPPVNELWTAKRVLDAGAQGVIFPFTSTPDLARQAVAACRYPPAGLRGSGAALAQAGWTGPGSYYDHADANTLVLAMIEDARGVENIDAIASTEGLDVLFIGTSDLSFSLGLRGEQDHPKLQAAIDTIAAAARRHGKVLGRPALTRGAIERYAQDGFQVFMTCMDLELMTAGASLLLGPGAASGATAGL
jgi:2-keto-3-deoxy-L-rhamnonate aldolase RhmA